MNLELKTSGGVLVVRVLDARVDAHGAPDLKARVSAEIESGCRKVLVNLADVDFVDSTGLGELLSLVKRIGPEGAVAVCGCRPSVRELLRLTRLDRVFATHASEAEGIDQLRR